MRKVLLLWLFVSLALLAVSVVQAQGPTAKIVVRGVSPEMIKTGEWSSVSSGLTNVGRGTKVWLEAKAVTGSSVSNFHYDTITALTWRMISKPTGSFTSILFTDTATGLMGLSAMMLPDSEGQYELGLTVTTANGTSGEATTTISAGHYVGVGGLVDPNPDYARGECLGCHSDKVDGWKTTKHSTKFSRDVDGITGLTTSGTTYASSCTSCHTVGVNKDSTAVNNGFDDVAGQFGWVLPETLRAGNWDSMKAQYPEVAKMANIQCENCHGPGSQHFGDKTKIAYSLSADVCAQCHDALQDYPMKQQWNNSAHSHSVAGGTNGMNIESKNRAPCAQCHSAQGFIDMTIDGRTLNVPYADVQSISCAACHDPHDGSHEHQLRRPSVAEACTGCHKNRLSGGTGLHGGHQGPMLAGSTGTPFTAADIPDSGVYAVGNWGGWQLPGYDYPNSSHTTLISGKCVQCHMADAPADSLYGLPAGTLWMKVGDHTFNVMWDHDTPNDESDDIVNPTGCRECHGTVSHEFVELSQNKIRALLDSLRLMLPLRSTGTPPPPKRPFEPGLTMIQRVASYNWYFVNNDGSFGVHNHNYAKALLQSSIEQLRLGAGAADIVSVADVPNDQGKMVQVVWNQFPAERYALDPVTSYGVWRQDSIGAGSVAAPNAVKSFREMFSQASAAGSRFTVNGSVWTFLGSVPAAGLAQYSFDAPTLYDSTITDGMKQTTFYVSGQTATPGLVYASAPASGYSIDNLAPAPPTGLTARSGVGVAILSWDQQKDKDFRYFAIYRGATPDFIPQGDPIASTSNTSYTDEGVVTGSTYYYRLAAFDFSGNKSQYSSVAAVGVTDVAEGAGIPTEYALQQNNPNPFNPTTLIRYQIPEATHVKISIYNTLGVLVATLVDRDMEAGYYAASWDGEDRTGTSVASGIYVYRMDAREFSSVKKMLLLR